MTPDTCDKCGGKGWRRTGILESVRDKVEPAWKFVHLICECQDGATLRRAMRALAEFAETPDPNAELDQLTRMAQEDGDYD